jgi:hypothetical protein
VNNTCHQIKPEAPDERRPSRDHNFVVIILLITYFIINVISQVFNDGEPDDAGHFIQLGDDTDVVPFTDFGLNVITQTQILHPESTHDEINSPKGFLDGGKVGETIKKEDAKFNALSALKWNQDALNNVSVRAHSRCVRLRACASRRRPKPNSNPKPNRRNRITTTTTTTTTTDNILKPVPKRKFVSLPDRIRLSCKRRQMEESLDAVTRNDLRLARKLHREEIDDLKLAMGVRKTMILVKTGVSDTDPVDECEIKLCNGS